MQPLDRLAQPPEPVRAHEVGRPVVRAPGAGHGPRLERRAQLGRQLRRRPVVGQLEREHPVRPHPHDLDSLGAGHHAARAFHQRVEQVLAVDGQVDQQLDRPGAELLRPFEVDRALRAWSASRSAICGDGGTVGHRRVAGGVADQPLRAVAGVVEDQGGVERLTVVEVAQPPPQPDPVPQGQLTRDVAAQDRCLQHPVAEQDDDPGLGVERASRHPPDERDPPAGAGAAQLDLGPLGVGDGRRRGEDDGQPERLGLVPRQRLLREGDVAGQGAGLHRTDPHRHVVVGAGPQDVVQRRPTDVTSACSRRSPPGLLDRLQDLRGGAGDRRRVVDLAEERRPRRRRPAARPPASAAPPRRRHRRHFS